MHNYGSAGGNDRYSPQVGEQTLLAPYRDDASNQISPNKETFYPNSSDPMGKRRGRTWLRVLLGLLAIALIAAAIAVPLALTVGKKKSNTDSSGSSDGSGSDDTSTGGSATQTGKTPTSTATSGKAGSRIVMEDGTSFVYANTFGGDWAFDPKKPFAAGGKAQDWSPRVGSEEWVWGQDVVRGVNLGGWLLTEPFIVPGLYEKYLKNDQNIAVEDEWTLSQALGDKLEEVMEEHYKTFITEQDFAEIAAAGLNWVRVPIGYWAIETWPDEPYLAKVSWKYFLKAVGWARKYGLRIYCDLHGLPGSQNGWNHSGKSGSINLMKGVMGIANAQRSLTYLRIITEFISQPEYKDVVPMIGILNEIRLDMVGRASVESFYSAAYDAIRKASGIGAGNGPYIAFHEGFQGAPTWSSFMKGADRLVLDQHPYLAFMGIPNPSIADSVEKICTEWGVGTNHSQQVFGVTVGGEWSVAINNCALWLNSIPAGIDASCFQWDDWASWDSARIDGFKQVALASMDALQNWFFWTWKIGESTVLFPTPTSTSPQWHYRLGLEKGWIPKDPREAAGYCSRTAGFPPAPFDGNFPETATGKGPAGTLASQIAFPPATIRRSDDDSTTLDVSLLPRYTATGTLITMPGPTFTAAPKEGGSGWNNPNDNELAYVPISGCAYPSAFDAVSVPVPAATCS